VPPPDRPPRRDARPARIGLRRVTSDLPMRLGGDDAFVERNVQAHLAHALGRDIVGGLYRPGSLLPNVFEMCSRFSVSRTALREAYSTLAAKGLIVARPKVGTRVRPTAEWNMLDPEVLAWHLQAVPNEDFIADLYALRQMVEPAAAAQAASRPLRATIERIGTAYADMERFKDGAGDLVAADLRFHSAILEATGNRFIGALASLIHAALLATFSISWEGAARIKDERLHQHRAVFEAIRDGLPKLASQRMAILLRDSFKDVHKGLHRRGAAAPAEVPASPE
jgi:GntR family galactonate operon transcriptional repressor